jgi:phenylacetic acid degradation operon negative regulatory protein
MDDRLAQQRESPSQAITIESRPVRTQFLIFTLFGDYVVYHGGKIWTSSLLELMELLGVSERAVRSTLSRMTRKGWLTSKKFGRRSQYSLTPRGKVLIDEGFRRIFEPIITDWDGHWHLVMYSLPEEMRRMRHTLRTRLTWLGFGRLSYGTWLSPHDRSDDLSAVLDDLALAAYVDQFSGVYLGPATAGDLVQRCWDLEALESQYIDFIERYQPEYRRTSSQSDGQLSSCKEDCFIRRYWLTHEFQSFPLRDPHLPTALLSPDWAGFAARRLFSNYHQILGTFAKEFVDEVMDAGEE